MSCNFRYSDSSCFEGTAGLSESREEHKPSLEISSQPLVGEDRETEGKKPWFSWTSANLTQGCPTEPATERKSRFLLQLSSGCVKAPGQGANPGTVQKKQHLLHSENSIYCTQFCPGCLVFVRGVPKERRWQRRGEWCQRRGRWCSQSFSQQSQELQPVSGSAGRAGHAPGAAPTPQEKQCPALGHLKSSSSPESHQGYSDTASWTRFAFRFQESTEYFMKMVGSTGIFCHSHCKLKHFPALSKWDYKSGFICLSLGTFCFTLQKKRKKQHISTNSFFLMHKK